MHISEGVLSYQICIGGYAAAAGLAALALKSTKQEDIPKISVMGAAFFVSSLIHFKIGMTSVHLTLLGLFGPILGFPAVLALITGLFFQAVMFQHGGLSTLGVNTVVMGLPIVIGHYLFYFVVRKWEKRTIFVSLSAGFLGSITLFLAGLLVMVLLIFTDPQFEVFAFLFSASHGVLAIIEGVIAFIVVRIFLKFRPDMLYAVRRNREVKS